MNAKKQTDGHLGRQVNVRLKDEDAARLDRLTAKHGGVASTIKAALKALEGSNELTNAELLATLAARLNPQTDKKTTRDIATDTKNNPHTEEHRNVSSGKFIVAPPQRKNKDL